MLILDRYLIKNFVLYLLGSLALLTLFYFFGDLLSKVWRYDAPFTMTLSYFFFLIPQTVQMMFSLACLAASLLTLANMQRNNELVALFISGYSIRRLATMILLSASFCSILFFWVGEWIIPASNLKANAIFEEKIARRAQLLSKEDFWMRDENKMIHIGKLLSKEGRGENIRIYHINEDFELFKIERAKTCKVVKDSCFLEEGSTLTFSQGEIFPTFSSLKSTEISILPLAVRMPRSEFTLPPSSFFSVLKSLKKTKRAGPHSRRLEVILHSKIAYIFACIVMAFLGIPFGLRKKVRKTSMAADCFIALLVALSFWLTFTLGLSFGYAGFLPPSISVWVPNLIFVGVGFLCLKKIA